MKLENALYRLDLDPKRGTIRQIRDKRADLDLIADPRIAEPFRLLLPLPEQEANYIYGRDQAAPAAEKTRTAAHFRWEGPLTSELGRVYSMGVSVHYELIEEAIHCRIDVENRSDLTLAEVWYPMVGGLTGYGERRETRSFIPCAGSTYEAQIFQNFPESMGIGGGSGNTYPEFHLSYPGQMPMAWIDFYNPRRKRGLYFALHETIARFGVMRLEMHPGVAHNTAGDNWPRPEEIEPGAPVGVLMNWVKFPYVEPGGRFTGHPMILQTHEGDWHQAARIYSAWFRSQFSVVDPRASWLHREQVYQDVISLLPEGNVHLRFRDIPQFAQDGLDYGVKALIVSSYNVGGHDAKIPSYDDPDPRLGTWEELKAAVAACHERGVKVFFFVNLQPVDMALDWYEQELKNYVVQDRWGIHAMHMGWGMGTLGARLGYTRRPLVPCNPGITRFREIIVRQLVHLAEIGADGVHFDKLGWPIGLDFNPRSDFTPDRGPAEGILLALHETLDACRRINPHFVISCEYWWDRLLEFATVAWAWHTQLDHEPALKFTFPEWMPMMPVVQPYAWNVVNNATRYGYQVMVGAARFSRSMQDPPMRPLSQYIAEVLRIREELVDFIQFGEFLDTQDARVEAHEDVRFNVHRHRESGKRACVIVNLGLKDRPVKLRLKGNHKGRVELHAPFKKKKPANLPLQVKLPPRGLLIAVEQ